MINAYEIYYGFKNFLQDNAIASIVGKQTRLSHTQELACIDLLFSLAPEKNMKNALALHKTLAKLSDQRLSALKLLIEKPHLFKLGGRDLQLNHLPHLHYFIGCGLISIIESRLKEFGISHDKMYHQKIQQAYRQLRINRMTLNQHSNISLKSFVADRAEDHLVVDMAKHYPDQFYKAIPEYANARLIALNNRDTRLNKTNSFTDIYIITNLCLLTLFHLYKHPEKTLNDLLTSDSDHLSTLLMASLVLSFVYKLSLLHQKINLHHEKTTMHSLFHKNTQQAVTTMCADIAHDNINQSWQQLKQRKSITLN